MPAGVKLTLNIIYSIMRVRYMTPDTSKFVVLPLNGIPTVSEARRKSWANALMVPPLLIAMGPS